MDPKRPLIIRISPNLHLVPVAGSLPWREEAFMSMRRVGNWLQIAGLFGVIGSLLFVGLQIKQNREIALSEI